MPKIKKRLTEAEREELRQRALSEGREYKFTVCLLCGLNRALSKTGVKAEKKGKIVPRVSFGNFDLENAFFIQARKGGLGKSCGFWLDETNSLTLEQAKESKEYDDLFEQIKKQCQAILKVIT